jgi:hypothetical protein
MLPPFAEDKETVLVHLEEFGFARIPNALDADELIGAKQRLEEQATAEQRIGHATLDGWDQKTILEHAPDRFAELPPGPNQRVWNLINKGEIFRKIIMKDYTLDLVKTLLSDLPDRGDEILLSSFTANIANPGGADMQIHSDQGFAPDATPYPIVANIMWMLDDFTKENGATRVVPGSHKKIAPRPQKDRAESVAVTGPAGSAMIFDGRLWHGTGSNTSDQSRLGILSYYCRPFIRQQENFTVSLAPEVLEQCSKELRNLLGFRTWGTLGMVERGSDNDSEGRILGADEWVRRPTSYVTELK